MPGIEPESVVVKHRPGYAVAGCCGIARQHSWAELTVEGDPVHFHSWIGLQHLKSDIHEYETHYISVESKRLTDEANESFKCPPSVRSSHVSLDYVPLYEKQQSLKGIFKVKAA